MKLYKCVFGLLTDVVYSRHTCYIFTDDKSKCISYIEKEYCTDFGEPIEDISIEDIEITEVKIKEGILK